MNKINYIIITTAIILFFILLYVANISFIAFIQYILEQDKSIKLLIYNNFFISILFTMIIAIICIILLLPITPIVIISGYYFSFLYGFGIIYVAQIIGSIIIFYSSNFFIKREKYVSKVNNLKLKLIIKNLENYSFYYLLLIRTLGGIPFSLQSILAHVAGMNFYKFLIATAIGIIPWIYIYITFGVTLKNLSNINNFSLNEVIDTNIFIALTLIIVILSIPVLIKLNKFINK